MSSDRPPDGMPRRPTPLDYRPPAEDLPTAPSSLSPWTFLAGLLLAVGGVICAGGNWYLSLYGLNPGRKTVDPKPPIVFASLTVAAIAALVVMFWSPPTRPLRPARFFVIGLITGLGLAALGEGVCFLDP